ncbi:MAG TPA: ATP-binding protein [Thermodesulfobacteriota bacterium]|nr:ATP-binding protein [Thermodesulfobacteriota bacterium]
MIAQQPTRENSLSDPSGQKDDVLRLRTARDAALQAAHAAIRDATRLTRLLSILSDPSKPEQMLDRALSTLSELFAADIVVLIDPVGTGNFVPIAAVGLPEESIHLSMSGNEAGYINRVMTSRSPLLRSEVLNDPRVEFQLRDLGTESAVWVPVIGTQDPRGVLILGRCQPTPFVPDDVGLLGAISYRIGLALEQTQRNLQLKQIVQSGRDIGHLLDESEICKEAVRILPAIVGADGAALVLRDQNTGGLHCVAQYGLEPSWAIEWSRLAERHMVNPSPTGIQFYSGSEFLQRPETPSSGSAPDSPVQSLMAIPILCEGQTVGLFFAIRSSRASFSTDTLQVASLFTAQVAAAIQNARLYRIVQDEGQLLQKSEKQLRKAHDQLEIRVAERTQELAQANQTLKVEIQERKEAQREAVRAKEIAENANRAKSEFLANMSHELRTPLNHILGFTELVLGKAFGDLNSTQEEYLNDVLNSGKHLLSLINDILDLAKVEAGRMDLELEEVDIRGLVATSLKMVQEKAFKHRIALKANLENFSRWVRIDERKLRQVLYNLLGNALKFTPDGGEVRITGELADGSFLKIMVKDTGVGIDPDDLERIFLPFEQGDNSSKRSYQGTGLGLTLTRRFVELLGGKIWAESEGKGKGSTFSLEIPL